MEGALQLRDALEAGAEVLEVFIEDPGDDGEVEQLCRSRALRCHRVDRAVGRALSQTVTAPGVVAVVRSPGVALGDIRKDADLIVVLAEVRDPGNAGTLIRSAAAAGADAVIFAKGAVDPLSAKTSRSAAGALFRIPIVLGVELEHAIEGLRKRGLVLVAADPRAEMPLEACDMTRPLALILGNEAQGVPPRLDPMVDETVVIPMPGATESLNVAVAGSVLLFEAVRQRRMDVLGRPAGGRM